MVLHVSKFDSRLIRDVVAGYGNETPGRIARHLVRIMGEPLTAGQLIRLGRELEKYKQSQTTYCRAGSMGVWQNN